MIRVMGIICASLALLVVGCGDDSDSSGTVSYEPWTPPAGIIGVRDERTAANFPEPDENGLVGSELKPVIPDGPPPEFLVSLDIIDGFSAPTASPGDQLTVQYVGFTYDSKEKFASSWDEGKPFTFTLGEGEVIEGWEEGLLQAEASDRRELFVPPELVTGGSRMKGIPEDSDLVFVIEVLKIKEAN
jgi:peptidylprolyl isomerase